MGKYTISFVFAMIIFLGCTPVGTRTQSQQKQTPTFARSEKLVKGRFSDTTYVYLGEYNPPREPYKSDIAKSDELKYAIDLYHKERYTEACEQFSNLLTKTNKMEKDYQIILYYTSECYIVKNMFEPAKKILQDVLSMENLFDDIKERCLVRLGQIYCVENKPEEANRLFRQLRREYPGSKFIRLADCDAVRK